jgi:hypothetical protein
LEPTANAVGNVDNTSRARFTMADSINVGTVSTPTWVPAAVRGDGRLRDGNPVRVEPATSRKNGQTITSTFYYMPWATTITEVPYPLPSP